MAKKKESPKKSSKPEPKKVTKTEPKPSKPATGAAVKAKAEQPSAKKTYPELVDTRLHQIRFRFQEMKVEGLVVTYLPNIRYLTNFSGSNAMLFIFEDKFWFFTDDRYKEQVKTELYALPNMEILIARDVWTYCVENKLLATVDSLAFEGDRVAYSDAVNIRNQIRPLKFKPSDPQEVERYTMPKSPEELAYIKQACALAELTYKKIIKFIKPGVDEKSIANEISYISRKLGSEGDPFDIIVTSGPRGALVHGAPSDRKIKTGDIVILDFGCKVNGFVSDITRTVAVGKASKEHKETYRLLVEAKEAAITRVRPHMNGKHLDEVARNIIKKAGFGQYFEHSLGHGIGLVPHESPIITFRLEDQIIPEDSVLAIEPGVYFPGKYGMRVEDNIFVKREGATHLTKAPDELPVI